MQLLQYHNILVIVAHQDDESLYFGGLLSELRNASSSNIITIACMTAPMPGRKDSLTRIEAFNQVCQLLNAQSYLYDFQDYHQVPWSQVEYQLEGMVDTLEKLIAKIRPEVIFTHNKRGEPNQNYSDKEQSLWRKLIPKKGAKIQGHVTHKLVHYAARKAAFNQQITLCQTGIGMPKFEYEVYYNMHAKKALLDCYLPQWSPKNYQFCYLPEKYVEVRIPPK